MKIGRTDIDDEISTIHKVRQIVGDESLIRLDANCAFDYETAISFYEQINNLNITPWRGVPGVKNVSAKIQVDQGWGAVLLKGRQTELDFSGLFRAPLKLEQLDGLAQWIKMPDGTRLPPAFSLT